MLSRENLKIMAAMAVCLLLAWTGPSFAHGVHAKWAHNAGKVDGKSAVGAGAGLNKAKGRLVAHNRNGKLPPKFIPRLGSGNLKSGAVGSSEIGDGAVTRSEIGEGAVTNGKIGSKAVTGNKIAPRTVSSDSLFSFRLVTKVSPVVPPGSSTSARATCPSGSRVITGGFTAHESADWRVRRSVARISDESWYVVGRNMGREDARLIAWAHCMS